VPATFLLKNISCKNNIFLRTLQFAIFPAARKIANCKTKPQFVTTTKIAEIFLTARKIANCKVSFTKILNMPLVKSMFFYKPINKKKIIYNIYIIKTGFRVQHACCQHLEQCSILWFGVVL